MAEAAGLALGGIGLASLVTTCVDFLQYFEDGQHYMRDFTLAATKVKLMKVRLGQLGDIEKTSIPSCQLDGFAEDTQHGLHHVADALPDGVLGIKDIIRRATKLCKRYSCSGDVDASVPKLEAQFSSEQEGGGSVSSGEMTQASRRAVLQNLKRKTSWALHDKKKFDGLIADFDFILCNLERIIECSKANTKPKAKTKPETHRKTPIMENQKVMNMSKKRDNTQGKMDDKPNTNEKTQDAHTGQKPAQHTRCDDRGEAQAPTFSALNSFLENQSNGRSIHFVGGQKVRGDTNNFKNNDSHDQSIAFTGHFEGAETFMNEIAKGWVSFGMCAMTQNQHQAKSPMPTYAESETE
ncbi:hypothetical protein VMCG_09743 [Cytospora schulzeri]|uniref:Prion-inhibition and propagation HeLo domain-containing protein n=1 Tax=Cytospora schulzeri TaxID=448051 RepID=A0A423VH85_9PEZI|nr:hypothetical protein VMCG_09743 [Valsa malicola]